MRAMWRRFTPRRIMRKLWATNARYWSAHNVTSHAHFADAAASLAYFHWRNDQYIDYIKLLPVRDQDGKVVLDYGCGPGNDLVGFGHYSKPARLIGMDVATQSLAEAKARTALHGITCELHQLDEAQPALPLADASVDYIHSSGVLHHVRDPESVLRELRRVLKPDGTCRVMIYNYDSLWLHLYVAFQWRIQQRKYADVDLRTAFARSTDGENCPIARVYQPAEWIALAERCGWRCRLLGVALSLHEMNLLPERFHAAMNPALPEEHRRFLLGLTFDERGLPLHQGQYAGIDGCYEMQPA